MKTIVIANQKGGVGKTAVLVHLAWYLMEQGKKVLVLDLDTQANASYTLSGTAHSLGNASDLYLNKINVLNDASNLAIYSSDSKLANIRQENLNLFLENINKISNDSNYDICLIDTPPSLGIQMISSLYASDFVISPIEMEIYSIQGISSMLKTIKQVQNKNKSLVFMGMFPSKYDTRSIRQKNNLKKLAEKHGDLIFPYVVTLRSSIAEALGKKEPVWTIKRTAARTAAKEFYNFANAVIENIWSK